MVATKIINCPHCRNPVEVNGKRKKCSCGTFFRSYGTGRRGGGIKKIICQKVASFERVVYHL